MPIVFDSDAGTVTGLSVGGLPDGIVDSGTLATNSVDSAELIDGAVDASHLASGVGFDPDGAVTINESGADVDFRVEGSGEANALFVQGSDGAVGIGTASPSQKLMVYGSGVIQPIIESSDSQARLRLAAPTASYSYLALQSGAFNGTDTWAIGIGSSPKDLRFTPSNDAGDTPAIIFTRDGNVGIGVTPESNWASNFDAIQLGGRTSVISQSDAYTYINNNNYYSTNWKYQDTAGASQYRQNSGEHTFWVAGAGTADTTISFTKAMTIDNNGNIFLYDFDESGGSKGIRTDDDCRIKFSNSGTGTQEHLRFYNGNGLIGQIHTNGSSTSFQTSSDYRLKENVVPMTGSIDRLKELKPSKFNFIADADKTVDGFLAHEVSDYVPEAITGTKDAMRTEEYEVEPAVLDDDGEVVTEAVMGEREVIDPQGIDQSKLVPLLTSALQEAVAKIEELTTRIETLENT